MAAAVLTGSAMNVNAQKVKNVVLVHGAFADGSGWRGLYSVLTKKGYHVTVVQNPLSSLEDDVTATKVALDKQDGPAILVGHSWGGAVITEAGNHPKVAALVYVAAFQPDNAESALQWLQTAKPAPENGVLAPDDKGFVTPIPHAAWRDKPTLAALATEDKSIDPGIQHGRKRNRCNQRLVPALSFVIGYFNQFAYIMYNNLPAFCFHNALFFQFR